MGSGQKENTLEFCLDVKRPLPVNLVRGKRFAHPVISSTEDLAMLRNSELVVFDEPTSGLDKKAIIDLRKTIRWISGRSLVIVIDHTGAFDNLADIVIDL